MKKIALKWYGGKHYHLKFLLPLFPRDGIRHFVDLFGGGGHVILNVEPYPLMTYNDINEDLYNFFKILRENPDEFIKRLSLTPYSRNELRDACTKKPYDDIERARFFFIRSRQAIHGLTHSKITDRQWSKTNKSLRMNSVSAWLGSIPKLYDVVESLRYIQVECDPADKVIDTYDETDVFFYVDPPYLPETRTSDTVYEHDMTTHDHKMLAQRLNAVKGKVVLSGYKHYLYEKWYDGWEMIEDDDRYCYAAGNNRRECVWRNFS